MHRAHAVLAAVLATQIAACNDPAPETRASANPPAATPPRAAPAQPPVAEAKPSPSSVVADLALSSRGKQALAAPDGAPPVAASGSVEVAASNGVVTLYGTVDAPSTKERAALAALSVEGVRSVVNNLVVVRGS